jgi:hypothetical protein
MPERPKHNPHQLRCLFTGCQRWFRNQSGRTKHIRSCHSGQPESRHHDQHSSPTNANEAQNTLPIHRSDESSSQGNQLEVSTPPGPSTPSTPLAVSRFSPGPFSPVYTLHSSPRRESSPDASVSTPEGDEPILKVFHPLINGLFQIVHVLISQFLLTKSFSRSPLRRTWQQFATEYSSSSST